MSERLSKCLLDPQDGETITGGKIALTHARLRICNTSVILIRSGNADKNYYS
jgi:hypothetical protein